MLTASISLSRLSEKSVRFLLTSGKPIGEPEALQGLIVMNTDKELHLFSNQQFNDDHRI
jgi:redox-sensitive bicupin YhaK (pirin superfamily)